MLEKFFELYADAFLSLNAIYISTVYDYPMAFYTEEGEMLTIEKEAFARNTQQVLENYKSIGIKNISFEIKAINELSESLKLVSVQWYFKDDKNDEVYNATTKYVFREKDKGLKIKSVFVIDETSKFNKLKKI